MSEEKPSIGMPEVRFIGSCGKCPNCGSTSVRFKLPLESYIETENLKLNRVVLDFTNPNYWLNTTVTTCAECGFQFHLRDSNPNFYQGLEETKQKEGATPVKWSYKFDDYTEEE
ncbi:MAG: hypothetical protein ACTSR8_14845 [Promethearchaeota archaeon]